MRYLKVLVVVLAAGVISLAGVTSADAQGRRASGAAGRAVPRSGGVPGGRVARPVIVSPRGFGGGFYRPYYYPYYPYGPGLTIGLGLGFPYGAVYPFYGSYSYGYYGAYGYGYPYAAGGYYSALGVAYGGVRIEGAPRDAQVFADGYYVGIVDDFDGVFQHVNLTPGTHRIEIRAAGAAPITVDVRLQPGQTITYRADLSRN